MSIDANKDQLIDVLRAENSSLRAEILSLRNRITELETRNLDEVSAKAIQGISALSNNLRSLEKRLYETTRNIR